MDEHAAPDPEQLLAESAWLRRLARSLVRDAHTADDLVQEAWLAALKHGPHESSALGPWLGRVVRNLALRRVRSEAHRQQREAASARRESSGAAQDLEERVALQRELLELVLDLEQPYRSTLLERYFEERSPAEIARRSGLPVRTVKTRLARGLALLRERLARRRGENLVGLVLALGWLGRDPAPWSSEPIGGLLVNWKLATACALVLLGAGGVLWMRSRPELEGSVALATGAETVTSEPSASPRIESAAETAARATNPTPPESVAVSDDDLGAIRGFVVDSRHVPIAGAEIEVSRALGSRDVSAPPIDDARTRIALLHSDRGGRFRVPVASGLSFDLVLHARGFAPFSRPAAFAGDELVVVLGSPATLEGHVLKRADGSPCAGAHVRVRSLRPELPGPLPSEAETDSQGRYVLQDLPPGALSLDALPLDAAPLVSIQVQVPEGAVSTREVLVEAGAEVEGRMLDADNGDPIAGAQIGDLWNVAFHTAVSDADGRFHLRGVSGGIPSTLIHFRAEGYGLESLRVPTNSSAPTHVEVHLHKGFHARGSLVDARGNPIAGASVRATGRGPTYDSIKTRSDPKGGFELDGLRRDLQWLLRVDADSAATLVLAFPEPPVRGSCVDFGELALNESALLRGRLVDARGSGIEGFYVCLERDRLDSGPFPSEVSFSSREAKHQVRTNSKGCFSLAGLGAGTYSLWAGLKGCARTVEQPVQVLAGTESEELLLTLDLGESISGVLVGSDGGPVPAGMIEFYTTADELHRVLYLLTGTDGTFHATGLTAGNYTIVADPGALSSANQLAGHAPNRWENVRAGTQDLRLALIDADPIDGLVLLPDGSKCASSVVFAVRCGSSRESYPEFQAFTDPEGRFRMQVPRGIRVDVFAHRNPLEIAADGTVERAEAKGVAAGMKGVELRLKRGN